MKQKPVTPPIRPEALSYENAREIAEQMNLLKFRLGRLHLFKAMHAVDEATRAFGYEVAEKLDPR